MLQEFKYTPFVKWVTLYHILHLNSSLTWVWESRGWGSRGRSWSSHRSSSPFSSSGMMGGSAKMSRSLSLGQDLMTSSRGVWGLVFTPSTVRETREEPTTWMAGSRSIRGPGNCTERLSSWPDHVWRAAANTDPFLLPLVDSSSAFTDMEQMSGHKRLKLSRQSEVTPLTSFRCRIRCSSPDCDKTLPRFFSSGCFREQLGSSSVHASFSLSPQYSSHNISSSSSCSSTPAAAPSLSLQPSMPCLFLLSLHTSSSLGTPSL